uniref:Uncharacterized protein n=1 Tax=Rhizophora mucronata TaxID=61149 RepID=A0A2P2MES0_RHIMU
MNSTAASCRLYVAFHL